MKSFIKQRAKECNISLQDIAAALGLSSYPSFLRTIETGENLKAKQLKTIAQMLNCTIDELVNGEQRPANEIIIRCEKCGNPIKIKIEQLSSPSA